MSTQISQYYSGKFPFSALEKLLTARGDDISQREFGLDGAFFQRYVCSADRGGLKQSLTQQEGATIHVGPVYSGRVSRPKGGHGASVPARRELVFDIDLTDYDFLGIGKPVDMDLCDRCWPVAGLAMFFIRFVLERQFGFSEFLVVYSGRRGAHLWVSDERAMVLTKEGREAIASFVNCEMTKDHARASSGQRKFVETLDLQEVVEHAFEHLLIPEEEGGVGLLDSIAARFVFVGKLGLKHPSLSQLADECGRQPTGLDAFRYVKTTVCSESEAPRRAWFRDRLQETLIGYVWPRLDHAVTASLNHLIKAPFSVHPSSLRVAVPVHANDLLTFKPADAPTLGTPSMSRLGRYVAVLKAHATLDADVEDAVKAPPRPRKRPFVRKPSPLVTTA